MSAVARELLSEAAQTKPGKEITQALDAIPPSMGGGWEDDAARAFTRYAQYAKEAAPTMAVVPALVKLKRRIAMAGEPKTWPVVPQSVPTVPGSMKLAAPEVNAIRYQNTPGELNPAPRRGGYYTSASVSDGFTPSHDYNVQGGSFAGMTPIEGGSERLEMKIHPRNPLPFPTYTFFGSMGLPAVGATKRSGPVVHNSTNTPEAHELEDLRSGLDPVRTINSFLPKRIRLNNADARKIGIRDSPSGYKGRLTIGASTDALGDYLISNYANSYGYDSIASRAGWSGKNARNRGEMFVPAPGRHGNLPITMKFRPPVQAPIPAPNIPKSGLQSFQEYVDKTGPKKPGWKPSWKTPNDPVEIYLPPKNAPKALTESEKFGFYYAGLEGMPAKQGKLSGNMLATEMFGPDQVHVFPRNEMDFPSVLNSQSPGGLAGATYPELDIKEIGGPIYSFTNPHGANFPKLSVVPGHSIHDYYESKIPGAKYKKTPKSIAGQDLAQLLMDIKSKPKKYPPGLDKLVEDQIAKIKASQAKLPPK